MRTKVRYADNYRRRAVSLLLNKTRFYVAQYVQFLCWSVCPVSLLLNMSCFCWSIGPVSLLLNMSCFFVAQCALFLCCSICTVSELPNMCCFSVAQYVLYLCCSICPVSLLLNVLFPCCSRCLFSQYSVSLLLNQS